MISNMTKCFSIRLASFWQHGTLSHRSSYSDLRLRQEWRGRHLRLRIVKNLKNLECLAVSLLLHFSSPFTEIALSRHSNSIRQARFVQASSRWSLISGEDPRSSVTSENSQHHERSLFARYPRDPAPV